MGALTLLFFLMGLVICGCAIFLAVDVHAIRNEVLPEIKSALGRQPHTERRPRYNMFGLHPHQLHHVSLGFFAIWEWLDGEWNLKAGLIPPGVHPGLPPAYPGAYNGDKVKVWVTQQGQ